MYVMENLQIRKGNRPLSVCTTSITLHVSDGILHPLMSICFMYVVEKVADKKTAVITNFLMYVMDFIIRNLSPKLKNHHVSDGFSVHIIQESTTYVIVFLPFPFHFPSCM